MKNITKHKRLPIIASVTLISLSMIAGLASSAFSTAKAEGSVNIKFYEGTYKAEDGSNKATNLFNPTDGTGRITASNCIVLPGEEFKDNINVSLETGSLRRLDSETFYMEEPALESNVSGGNTNDDNGEGTEDGTENTNPIKEDTDLLSGKSAKGVAPIADDADTDEPAESLAPAEDVAPITEEPVAESTEDVTPVTEETTEEAAPAEEETTEEQPAEKKSKKAKATPAAEGDNTSTPKTADELWAYSFTGWQIVGTDEKIPGKTIFQPGDVITEDIWKTYIKNGTLELQAVWGKCYFIEKPYENMVYSPLEPYVDKDGTTKYLYVLDTTNSTGQTGASDEYDGNNPEKPMATIDGLYAKLRQSLGADTTAQQNNPDTYDCYGTVVMLTGDIEGYTDNNDPDEKYYGYETTLSNKSKVVPVSATYKSFGDGKQYTYRYKPKGYANTTYGNFRFDNINFQVIHNVDTGQLGSAEFLLSQNNTIIGNNPTYIEITARYNDTLGTEPHAASTLRPADCTYAVVNGGIYGGMQNQYTSSVYSGKQLYWTIGRDAQIGTLTCGTTSSYYSNFLNLYYHYDLKILGGTITDVFGGNFGVNCISIGNRNTTVLGDNSGNTEYDPKITNLYGGASQSRLLGNVNITAKYCSNLGYVYGGGRDYSATTYGDVTITLDNCALSDDLFGGGKNANCEELTDNYIQYSLDENGELKKEDKPLSYLESEKLHNKFLGDETGIMVGNGGDVTLNITNTTVKGNIFGSGSGQSETLKIVEQRTIIDEWKIDDGKNGVYPDDWFEPLGGYPSYSDEDKRVYVLGSRRGSYTNTSPHVMSFFDDRYFANLSLATVKNVTMTITDSIIGDPEDNKDKGNIYGGGSIAKVLNDVKITLSDTTVYGNVYGGGDGVTVPEKVKVYWPDDDTEYKAPLYKFDNINNGVYTISWSLQAPTIEQKNFEEYEWSNDTSLLERETKGIDHENKLLYSPNTQGLGMVVGNTDITLNSGTEVEGAVYGGGNKGMVGGNTTVTVNGGTYNEVYGGCNAADVTGNTTLNIIGGTIASGYGGNNQTGAIGEQITVNLYGGTITGKLFGGGNKADYAGVPELNISGGTVGDITDTTIPKSTTTNAFAYGGGNKAKVAGTNVTVTGGEIYALVGGSFSADIGSENSSEDVRVKVTGGKIINLIGGNDQSGEINIPVNVMVNIANPSTEGYDVTNVFGGGNVADYTYNKDTDEVAITVDLVNGNVYQVYGGGIEADITNNCISVEGGTYHFIYGGGYKGASDNTYVYLNKGTVGGSVYGGGYEGDSGYTHVDIRETEENALILTGSIFGGGYAADVTNDTHVHFISGTVAHNIYGGGYEGKVLGTANVDVYSGTLKGKLYGGGYMGTSAKTNVLISDKAERIQSLECETLTTFADESTAPKIVLESDAFAGGEGTAATVLEEAYIEVDMDYGFEAKETVITVDEMTPSGEIETIITPSGENYSEIRGSVFGGGDLAAVGEGTILVINNSAEVISPGTTNVVIKNGYIAGDVFGGGKGVPPTGTLYNVYMGTVFGSTKVDIHGGYIGEDVYGGGTQSRLYGVSGTLAAQVNIDETVEEDTSIAIGGSVFGGGERGSGETTNASVPTTVGNVEVNISGNPNGPSEMYFLNGGIYGDGHLCLVSGQRKINVKDLTAETGLKTFYSLQRADLVVLDHAQMVLLGAIDLVEEGDLTTYSINRVSELQMHNGSTIKLDQIVKNLGKLTSDVDTDREFILNGNNKKNNYTNVDPSQPLGYTEGLTYNKNLTDSQINEVNEYRSSTTIKKNVVCVANGLYLEVKYGETYGAVKGLFTLELLFANPGEGGGYVYGSIPESTGDFICETAQSFVYEKVEIAEEDFIENTYYKRVVGKGYVLADTYEAGILYYNRQDGTGYMDVVDDVTRKIDDVYTCYQWYINGPTIKYINDITGYIGSDDITTEKENLIPHHDEPLLKYVLYDIEGSDTLANAIGTDGVYDLVQTKQNLTGQQIALEVRLNNESIGFLTYEWNPANEKYDWGLKKNNNTLYGYQDISENKEANALTELIRVDSNNDKVVILLHKSKLVNTELAGMKFFIEMDIMDEHNTLYGGGTSNLIFDVTANIIRLTPEQNRYKAIGKMFAGVLSEEPVYITGDSAFTTEYHTRYIANAYPILDEQDSEVRMHWSLSTSAYRYYMNENTGYYITLTTDEQGNDILVSKHSALEFDEDDLAEPSNDTPNKVYKEDDRYYYISADENYPGEQELTLNASSTPSVIPKNTKITMLDRTDENNVKYYYYICKTEMTDIDLEDFMLMGTEYSIKTVCDDPDTYANYQEYIPTFITEYESKNALSVRITERIAFVFDSYNVDWSTNEFSGSLFLRHTYEGIDIMDYVKSEVTNDTTKYRRESPRNTEYLVNPTTDGLNHDMTNTITADHNDHIHRNDTFTITVKFSEQGQWNNTLFEEQEYGLVLKMLDEDGDPMTLPAGMKFKYNGNTYYADQSGVQAIIPVELREDNKNQEFEIEVSTPLGRIQGDSIQFESTLYSAPDGIYYWDNAPIMTAQSQSIAVRENSTFAVRAETDDFVLEQGNTLVFDVEVVTDSPLGEKATVKVQKKTGALEYSDIALNEVFTGVEATEYSIGTHNQSWKTTANKGYYRLVFTYGEHVEYMYFIIR